MTTRKRNNTQRRGASSKAARMKVANVKRMFMAFMWLAIVVGLLYYIGRFMFNDMTAKGAEPAVDNSPLLDVRLMPGIEVEQCDYVGYRVYFNSKYHIPNCVVYELLRSETQGETPRYKNFEPDPNFEESATPADYTHSGYDRGHMAPAADMKWSSQAMHESFYMSNICPQDKSLNTGGWNKLENKVREWAERDSVLIVACGPIITDDMPTIGNNRVAVPPAFFKAVLAPCANPPRAIGFIYKNQTCKGEVKKYAVSIDAIEASTGYDLFGALPDDVEAAVEATYNYKDWGLR